MQTSIGLTFPGELKDESVICSICKNFNVSINILEASFSTSSGWAILGIAGEKEQIDEVFKYLTGKNIKVNKIKQVK